MATKCGTRAYQMNFTVWKLIGRNRNPSLIR